MCMPDSDQPSIAAIAIPFFINESIEKWVRVAFIGKGMIDVKPIAKLMIGMMIEKAKRTGISV